MACGWWTSGFTDVETVSYTCAFFDDFISYLYQPFQTVQRITQQKKFKKNEPFLEAPPQRSGWMGPSPVITVRLYRNYNLFGFIAIRRTDQRFIGCQSIFI